MVEDLGPYATERRGLEHVHRCPACYHEVPVTDPLAAHREELRRAVRIIARRWRRDPVGEATRAGLGGES